MDAQGIDKSILIPLPWIETVPKIYHTPKHCHLVAQKANDLYANLIASHSNQFSGVALISTTTPEIMIKELERCVKELGSLGGFIVVGATVKPPDHPDYELLYQKAVELDIPIWIHPSTPPSFPNYTRKSHSKYQIWQTLTWLYDTSAAMVRIVFSGVFQRYPTLKLIIHHHGSLIPLFSQRMQLGWDFF